MFGLFKKKAKASISVSTEIEAEEQVVEISDRDMKRMEEGWKQDENGKWRSPDTVWVSPRGEVYHRFYYCTGAGIAGAKAMTEREAIKRGYRKCSRCEWDRKYQYL